MNNIFIKLDLAYKSSSNPRCFDCFAQGTVHIDNLIRSYNCDRKDLFYFSYLFSRICWKTKFFLTCIKMTIFQLSILWLRFISCSTIYHIYLLILTWNVQRSALMEKPLHGIPSRAMRLLQYRWRKMSHFDGRGQFYFKCIHITS